MAKLRTFCYHCNVESTENIFKYFDNGKRNQPRYQCSNCEKLFTVGSQGRPQSKVYKERNVDPPELKGLHRECRYCGVVDNAPFKYYNNKNLATPRFQCLSCGQQFQMRVIGIREERRLVHTSSYRGTRNSDRQKLKDLTSKPAAKVEETWMPALEVGVAALLPALTVEDAKYFDLIEVGLMNERQAPSQAAVLRLQAWSANLPRSSHEKLPLNHIMAH